MEKEKTLICDNKGQGFPSRPIKRSFKETLKAVEDRIEWVALRADQRAAGRELAMIIAEVELLPPDALVRIEGNDLPAEMVAEVYSELTNDHVVLVLDQIAEQRHRIRAIKTYMRTALYNSVFTLDTAYTNMANSNT